jgi:putative (di)nucleoside polyphosphate hydrolase
MGKPHLRVGVVAAVRRADGLLLAFERSDLSGEWQLPQGGLELGETPEQAAWRELREETGLDDAQVALVDEYEGWTAYLWPEPMRRGERLGQAHRWFFFEPIVDPITPVPDGSEFSSWRWMTPGTLIERVVEFRRQPYRQVLGG